jgi:plasmid stabilization system protein ParE
VKVSTHPLAADELVDGAVFYARQATAALAEDFIAEFERSVAMLQAHPKLGRVWAGPFRRLPLRRFPYSIVYAFSADASRVVALAHHKRKPGYWRARQ